MTRLARSIALFFVFYVAVVLQSARAQSVLDPSDPVVTYDPANPPTQPAWGQIGKWVRTVRMTWNTDMYKAYIYKGMAFRLHFPKTYNPTANDGKKYPILIFFHGHGEYGPIYDNEFHLLHGHQGFDQVINNGTFDGYVLSAQSTDFFNITYYDKLIEIVNYMIANNKVDPFKIVVNGLSQGGQACWEMQYNFPTYVCASLPMSWTQTSYTDPTFVNKVKYTPTWVFQGSLDNNPPPSVTHQVRDAMVAAGADFTLTEYPNVGHGTWWLAWGEPDFWPFINRAYSSNPWQLGGKLSYWPGDPINATLGLPAGFSAYEWRKDGVLISGAATNTLTVTAAGVYSARVQRNGLWSEWSRMPASILPGRYQAEDYSAMSGVQTEYTQDEGGGKDVGWIEQGDWMEYSIDPNQAGSYTLKLRIATPASGGQLKVKRSDGTVLATVNVPSTGGWQTWQTIATSITLSQGPQSIRLESSATTGWNINWLEFTPSSTPGNLPPTVSAGTDKTITLPTNSVSLTGSASDPDGSIASYSWTKVSGGSATIGSPSSASTTVSGLTQGSYVFRLTVTDNDGATASDQVSVTVNAAAGSTTHIEAENYTNMSGVQKENTTDVGGGQSVGYIDPGDWMEYSYNAPSSGSYTVNLRVASPASGGQLEIRKPDGTVLATVNVPNTGGWQSWQTISTTISLVQGAQTIRIVSTSAPWKGWNINWWELAPGEGNPVNQAPTVSAGTDKTITLPTNSVTLSGTASDPDGSIASYSWTKVSGGSATIGSPSSASTTVSGLTQGSYVFRLTVTDNDGATASDQVSVTVNAAAGSTTHIEAENYTNMSGVQKENTTDVGGGQSVGYIDPGDWMEYSYNAPSSGSYTVNLRVASPASGGQLEIRKPDGTVLATVNVPNTGGWQSWQTISTTISLVQGAQTIRIVSTSAPWKGWNINWWELIAPSSAALTGGRMAAPPIAEPAATESMKAYPNPVRDQLTLTLNNAYSGTVHVQIIGVGGALVKQFSFDKASGSSLYTFNIGDLPKGQYILKAQMEAWKKTEKIIKQ